MSDNRGNPPSQPSRLSRRSVSRFSIQSILIVTLVMALTAASIGNLWRAGTGELSEVGSLLLFTNMAPLGIMILVSWGYRLVVGPPK
jgi:hypothetical protein